MPYHILRIPVAAILFFSAIMKAYATITEPVMGLPWFEILSVEYEFALALSLLLGLAPRLIGWVTIGTFLIFLTVALRLAWLSADSCGCFGKFHVDPKVTAIMDATIILLLLFSRVPKELVFPTRKQSTCFVIGMLLTILPVLGMARPHPPEITEHGAVATETKALTHDFGYVEPLSVHRFEFELENPTSRNWTIPSITTECDCIVVSNAPSEVKSREKTTFSLEFNVAKEVQTYSKKITVTTDDPDHPEIVYTIYARIGIPLHAKPERIEFKEIEPGKTYETTVTIINDGPKPVKLLYSQTTPAICFAKIPLKPILAGESVELPIVLRVPSEGISQKSLDLTLHTNYPEQRTLLLKVFMVTVHGF